MLWRVLAHFLTIALLASPGACPGHVHAGQSASGTQCSAQPHIHMHAGHLHPAQERHDGHCRHAKPEGRHRGAADEATAPLACTHGSGALDDAVYLPDSVNARATRKLSHGEPKAVDFVSTVCQGANDVDVVRSSQRATICFPGVHSHTPLYLQTRALRI